jgi:hypothetical protein
MTRLPFRLTRRFACLAVAALLAITPGRALAQSSVWELTPYNLQVFFACQSAPQLTEQVQQELRESLVRQVDQYVGAAWKMDVSDPPAGLAERMLADMSSIDVADLPSECLEVDKVTLLVVRTTIDGLQIQARELDCRTRQWSTLASRDVVQPQLVDFVLVQTLLASFAPLAQVEEVEAKQAVLRVRAASLPFRDPAILPVQPGVLFRPVLRFNDRDGRLKAGQPPKPTPWTYLLVRGTEENKKVQCEIFSAMRTPIPSRRRGRTEMLALAVLPPQGSTTLELASRSDAKRRLFGYEVFAYRPDSPTTTLVGRTDRNGRLSIPQGEDPLRILIVKSGGKFLARLPIVPGLEPLNTAQLIDDDERLAVEGYITGMQEQVVDLVAKRAMLFARIRARLDEGKPEEAQALVDELQRLRGKNQMAQALAEQRKKIFVSDAVVRRDVDKLFNDTNEVLNRNLDPRDVEAVTTEVAEALKAKSQPAKTASTTPAGK